MPAGLRLSLVTWNVHGFVGSDGRRDARRVVELLRRLDADVIALQEVDASPGGSDAFETLGPALGLTAIAGPTLTREGARYGNLLLSRHPVQRVRQIDLTQPDAEPRGAIDATIAPGAARVRVLATHLGLGAGERARQARGLCRALDRADHAPTDLDVLLGDLNEWRRPLSRTALAPLVARFPRRSRQRTFPARLPLLALDRVLVGRRDARLHQSVVANAAARRASDHLPLHVQLEIDAG